MNDTHRMDWLERNWWRVRGRKLETEVAYRFRAIRGQPGRMKYTTESETLRAAIDDAMKEEL